MHIVSQNSWRNFIVKHYDAAGERIDLLVNAIGAYEGTVIIPRDAFLFVLEAEEPWTVDIESP